MNKTFMAHKIEPFISMFFVVPVVFFFFFLSPRQAEPGSSVLLARSHRHCAWLAPGVGNIPTFLLGLILHEQGC